VPTLTSDANGLTGGPFPAGWILRETPSSPDEMEEMAKFWNLKVTQLGKKRYHSDLVAFHTARMQVSRVRHKNNSRIDGEIPADTVILAVPVTRGRPMQFHGTQVGPRDLIFQDRANGIDISYAGEMDILSIAISQSAFRRRLSQLWQMNASPLLSRTLRFSTPLRASLVTLFLCETVRQTTTGDALFPAPGHSLALENTILDTVLCALEEPTPPEGEIARRWIARRAAAIIHDRCREEIGIPELCEVVGASRRTLHLGFLDVYGTSPMKYLLSIRLAGVRRDLRRTRNRETGVTEIATAWGFGHLGRFSASYRQYFGTLPSEDAGRPLFTPDRAG